MDASSSFQPPSELQMNAEEQIIPSDTVMSRWLARWSFRSPAHALGRALLQAGLTPSIGMLNSPGPYVGLLAQLVEQRTFNPTVQGSSP